MIYNNPISYGVDITPEILRSLADMPSIVAIKEETGVVMMVLITNQNATAALASAKSSKNSQPAKLSPPRSFGLASRTMCGASTAAVTPEPTGAGPRGRGVVGSL